MKDKHAEMLRINEKLKQLDTDNDVKEYYMQMAIDVIESLMEENEVPISKVIEAIRERFSDE